MLSCAVGAESQPIQVDQGVRGSAWFEHDVLNTSIHATDKTIINYHRFDLSAQTRAEFIQSKATSRVLNRICSADLSVISRTLKANRIVYFVNPARELDGGYDRLRW